MDPRSGITSKLTVENWSTWSNQFSAHLMAKGLYQHIASEDALVIPSKHAVLATAASDRLTMAQQLEGDLLREKDRMKWSTFIDSKKCQPKETLLQNLSEERFSYVTSDVMIGTTTTKQLYDKLKKYATESENPKVQIRQQQFRLMCQGATEPSTEYLARLDAM